MDFPFVFCSLIRIFAAQKKELREYGKIHQSVYGRWLQAHLRAGVLETGADSIP